jgi:hypothetical protein
MYHELTQADIRKRRIRGFSGVLIVALFVFAAVFGMPIIRENARAQGAASIRETILSSAKQCCAVEGSYPSSLAHLEDIYGLTINHADYVITYEWFADNVLPSVVVIPR